MQHAENNKMKTYISIIYKVYRYRLIIYLFNGRADGSNSLVSPRACSLPMFVILDH